MCPDQPWLACSALIPWLPKSLMSFSFGTPIKLDALLAKETGAIGAIRIVFEVPTGRSGAWNSCEN